MAGFVLIAKPAKILLGVDRSYLVIFLLVI